MRNVRRSYDYFIDQTLWMYNALMRMRLQVMRRNFNMSASRYILCYTPSQTLNTYFDGNGDLLLDDTNDQTMYNLISGTAYNILLPKKGLYLITGWLELVEAASGGYVDAKEQWTIGYKTGGAGGSGYGGINSFKSPNNEPWHMAFSSINTFQAGDTISPYAAVHTWAAGASSAYKVRMHIAIYELGQGDWGS